MKREISCKLDGQEVIQTTIVTNDDGTFRKSVVRLGDRDIVLGQIELQVAEALRDRDGIAAASSAEPVPAATGKPGAEEVYFHLVGRDVYRTTVRRNSQGKIASQETRQDGSRANRIENSEERLRELTEIRDAIKTAK